MGEKFLRKEVRPAPDDDCLQQGALVERECVPLLQVVGRLLVEDLGEDAIDVRHRHAAAVLEIVPQFMTEALGVVGDVVRDVEHSLTGLDMPAEGLWYDGAEEMNLYLGADGDQLTLSGPHAETYTNIYGNTGDDRFIFLLSLIHI